MEDDGSPLNNFGKGLKKLFGKKPLYLEVRTCLW